MANLFLCKECGQPLVNADSKARPGAASVKCVRCDNRADFIIHRIAYCSTHALEVVKKAK